MPPRLLLQQGGIKAEHGTPGPICQCVRWLCSCTRATWSKRGVTGDS